MGGESAITSDKCPGIRSWSVRAHSTLPFTDSRVGTGSTPIGVRPRTIGLPDTTSLPWPEGTRSQRRSSAGGPTRVPWTSLSRRDRQLSRARFRASRQDLLLILDDSLLIPNDLDLIGHNLRQTILVSYDPVLVGDDLHLILDCGLRHCWSLFWFQSGCSQIP